jgi:hypothetical protein
MVVFAGVVGIEGAAGADGIEEVRELHEAKQSATTEPVVRFSNFAEDVIRARCVLREFKSGGIHPPRIPSVFLIVGGNCHGIVFYFPTLRALTEKCGVMPRDSDNSMRLS